MPLITIDREPAGRAPIIVVALSGWVDAASVGTDAAERLSEGGEVIATFDPDALFDYRSSRPVLHIKDGDIISTSWPKLEVFETTIPERAVLVVAGNEPDFRWRQLIREIHDLARRWDVERVITLGAVPAPVPHTRPARIVSTTANEELLLPSDEMLPDELVVPGAAVSVIRKGLSDAGVPAIGYFAQVPHYLNRPFHAGVLGLLERVGKQVGSPLAVGDLAEKAQRQRREIDLMLEEREDAREYVERLERINETELPAPRFEQLPTADEIAAEVERYLKQASDGEE